MPSNFVHQQRNKGEPPMFVPPARHFSISNLQSATHPRQQASQCQPKSFKNNREKIPPSLRYILQRAAPRPILPQPLPLDGGGPQHRHLHHHSEHSLLRYCVQILTYVASNPQPFRLKAHRQKPNTEPKSALIPSVRTLGQCPYPLGPSRTSSPLRSSIRGVFHSHSWMTTRYS